MKNQNNPASKDVFALLANSIVGKAIPENRIDNFAKAVPSAHLDFTG